MTVDLTAIREGLAANLHVCLEEQSVKQVSPWLLDNPAAPSLQVAGVRDMSRLDFGSGASITMAVEVAIPQASAADSQKQLDRLVLGGDDITSVWDAIEADPTLSSRFTPHAGLTDSTPACDSLAVVSYEGQSRYVFPNGVEALLGTWVVQVIV